MTLALATLPNDLAELPHWLEGHFVNGTLGELVAELAVLYPNTSDQGLSEVLQSRAVAIHQHGLSALPGEQLRRLLRSPRHLFELQEMVLLDGGDYWERLPRSQEVLNVHNRLNQKLPREITLQHRRVAWYQHPAVILATLAASVLLAVLCTRELISKAPGISSWGWAKDEGLPNNPDSAGYLNALADRADEWFAEPTPDSLSLVRRINRMREGCSILLLTKHPALNEAKKNWLRERCETWAKKLDAARSKLEAGTPVDAVREEVDTLIRNLTISLRKEASTG